MKFCKDCRHCQRAAHWVRESKRSWLYRTTDRAVAIERSYEYARCDLDQAVATPETINPVTGRVTAAEQMYCSIARRDYAETICGPDAHSFEPREGGAS